jgi:Domain of unknown function (DUF4388)
MRRVLRMNRARLRPEARIRESRKERDMIQETLQNEARVGTLLLSLHRDGSTGTLRVQQGEKDLRLYFKKGRLVYAEGVDQEGPLLVELVSRGKISLDQLDEFRILRQEDPHSLGKALLDQKVVSEALWRKFLLLKVTAILSAAFDMESPDLLFSESALNILPVNFIQEDHLPLVLDILRSTTPHNSLREILKSRDKVFGLSADLSTCKALLPLNPYEEKTLSLIDGQRTAKEVLKSSGLNFRLFQKSLYCLIRLGLVDRISQPWPISREHSYIIHLYLNLLLIVEANYRQEIGKRSQKIIKKCVADLSPPGKALFSDLDLDNENVESAAKKIGARFAGQKTLGDARLILLTSFNKLLYLLITRMKKLLGKKRAVKTIEEMIRALVHFDPGKKNSEIMLYVTKNLEDLVRQMQW